MAFACLESANIRGLEASFLKEKVFFALFYLEGDKAPKLDRFTMAVWQQC